MIVCWQFECFEAGVWGRSGHLAASPYRDQRTINRREQRACTAFLYLGRRILRSGYTAVASMGLKITGMQRIVRSDKLQVVVRAIATARSFVRRIGKCVRTARSLCVVDIYRFCESNVITSKVTVCCCRRCRRRCSCLCPDVTRQSSAALATAILGECDRCVKSIAILYSARHGRPDVSDGRTSQTSLTMYVFAPVDARWAQLTAAAPPLCQAPVLSRRPAVFIPRPPRSGHPRQTGASMFRHRRFCCIDSAWRQR